jgi:hypothetical protein
MLSANVYACIHSVTSLCWRDTSLVAERLPPQEDATGIKDKTRGAVAAASQASQKAADEIAVKMADATAKRIQLSDPGGGETTYDYLSYHPWWHRYNVQVLLGTGTDAGRTVLEPHKTLRQCGITTGSKLYVQLSEIPIEVMCTPPQGGAQTKIISAYNTHQAAELLQQLHHQFEGLQHVDPNTMQLVSADGTAHRPNCTLHECGIRSPTETGVFHKLTIEPISGVWRDLPPVDIVPIETQRERENRTQLEHGLRDYTATVLTHMRCEEERQQGAAHDSSERQPTLFDLFSVLKQSCANKGQELFLFDSRDDSEPGVVVGSPPSSTLVDNTPHLSRLADNNTEVVELVVGSLDPRPGCSADNQQIRQLRGKSPSMILGSEHNLQLVQNCFRTYFAEAFGAAEDKIIAMSISYKDGSYYICFPATGWTSEEKQLVYDAAKYFQANFKEFIQLRVHPLFQKLKVDIASFDARGHKKSWDGSKHSIGSPKEDYYQPAAGSSRMSYPNCPGEPMADQKWQRFGLNVLGKFKGGDRWLDPFDNPESWWRVYHGVEVGSGDNAPTASIIRNTVDESTRAKPDEILWETGKKYKPKLGPGVYVSPHLEYALCYSAGAEIKMPDGTPRRYQVVFQCAAKPGERLRSGYSWEIGPNSRMSGSKLREHCRKRYPAREDKSRRKDDDSGETGDSHPSDSEWTFKSQHVRPYGVLLADAAHLEQIFEMGDRQLAKEVLGKKLADLGTLEPEPEAALVEAIELYAAEVNLQNVIKLLRAPGTLAVRLHGSKNAQNLLKEVQDADASGRPPAASAGAHPGDS